MNLYLGLLLAASVIHPALPPPVGQDGAQALASSMASAMAYSPQELHDMVPPGGGVVFCGCPNCNGGAEEYFVVSWQPGMGDTVKCNYCAMVLPNAQYPNNREQTIVSPAGIVQTYRWHEDANGKAYHFQARAWYDRGYWTMSVARDLANLYALTGDTAYGDRAAAIVGRWARVYKEYPNRYDYPYRNVTFYPAYAIWPFGGDYGDHRPCKLYHWSYGDIPTELIRAYDMLAAGDALERMSGMIGAGIREKFEQDVIRFGFESVSAWPDAHDNMMPYTYSTMTIAGRVGGQPDIVHHAIEGARALMNANFTQDGWWSEGAPSYHAQVVANMEELDKVSRGYSDPPEVTENRYDNIDLAQEVPMLGKARRVMDEGVLPDGRMIPINDTHWHDKRQPLAKSPSRLWPGLGHAVLGAGEGATQFQLHLNWSGNYGHSHYDNGSLILWALGHELLSDVGYTNTHLRPWATTSASHNLVVVNATAQRYGTTGNPATGNPRWFDEAPPHVRYIDLDAKPAYATTSVYRRRLLHVRAAAGRDYVVDLFDVTGGSTHDYFLHGSADAEGTFALDASLGAVAPGDPMPGQYDQLTEIQVAQGTGQPWRATWRHGAIGLRTHLFHTDGTKLYAFASPAIRPANENEAVLGQYKRRGIMMRHAAGSSRFAAVHEPFGGGQPWLTSVTTSTDWETLTTRFSIEHDGIRDEIELKEDRASVRSGAGWRYDSGEVFSGRVLSLERGGTFALTIDREAPEIRAIRLTFGGGRSIVYPVAGVEGNRVMLADDPGFEYDPAQKVARFLYFPSVTLPGELGYAASRAEWVKTGARDAGLYQ